MQLASDRPYSVPNYHSSRKSRINDDRFARPPRPASTSEVDDIDKLVPRRQLSFLHRNTTPGAKDDSIASRINHLEDPEALLRVPKTTRRVAKRGSKVSTPDDRARTSGLSEFNTASKRDPSHLTSQKRDYVHTTDDPNPSKRIKINVIENQSQTTPIVPEIANQSYPNTRLRKNQLSKNNYENKIATKELVNQNIEVDDDETQSSEGDDNATETALTSKRLRQARAGKPDPYDIMDRASPFEISQDARYSRKKRASIDIEETNPRNDLNAIYQEPNVHSQRGKYTNTSQYNMPSEHIPSTYQVKPESKPSEHHYSAVAIGSTPSTQDAREGKAIEETLDARLSRIEKAIRVHEEEGIDEFIKAKLSTGNPNTLGTLTNEILLALVVPNDELLEQVIKIM
ncbi:uncharacterized protein GGS22DRAFT_198207 [Annulohypoxylon maeteangense]|uniref:uncharacterized protein n=1 Tax=Annulohypoxylon maeteangense TaxID=1927788 RepID=UPI00200885E3|nr:uncharacterized protein GGS22DRAFT_198207 [Annulohypoxylon maeteangense]KAI0888482.1 hypothetical protein GGS22DRAFT_198207 [Annulohypoxylon maeteangense]